MKVSDKRAVASALFLAATASPATADWSAVAHALAATLPKASASAAPVQDGPSWWRDYAAGKSSHMVSVQVTFADGQVVRANAPTVDRMGFNIGRGLRTAIGFYRSRLVLTDHDAVPEITGAVVVDPTDWPASVVGPMTSFDPAECNRMTLAARSAAPRPDASPGADRRTRLTAYIEREEALRAERQVRADARIDVLCRLWTRDEGARPALEIAMERELDDVGAGWLSLLNARRELDGLSPWSHAVAVAESIVTDPMSDDDMADASEAEPSEPAYPDAEDDAEPVNKVVTFEPRRRRGLGKATLRRMAIQAARERVVAAKNMRPIPYPDRGQPYCPRPIVEPVAIAAVAPAPRVKPRIVITAAMQAGAAPLPSVALPRGMPLPHIAASLMASTPFARPVMMGGH